MVQTVTPDCVIVLANLSRSKCTLLALPTLALGVLPNLPGFGDNLIRAAFFYTTGIGIMARLLASGILILSAMILLYCVLMTLVTTSKAVWLDGDDLKWGLVGTKSMQVGDIREVSFDAANNRIRLDRQRGGKPGYIATLGLRSQDAPGPLIDKLRALSRSA